ncbi:MAG: phosphate ABC transporter substrate-binding protein PstS [Parcubacteria group bacterium]
MIRKLSLALAATLMLAACGGPKEGPKQAQAGVQISGAGATFPAPLYAKWAEAQKAQTGLALNYQAIGSGGGIKQIEAKTVAFGASDKPLKADDLDKNGLVQFPTVMGGVVPVANLPGIAPGQIKLTGLLLADIYLGKVKKWNDPAIAQVNAGVPLPNLPITVVHRSDGSGTTFLYTSYLAAVAPQWASVGASDSVAWPTGVGGKGNDGVAAYVKQTPGAIGYVEYAYAKQNNMTYALLQNADGRFVAPTAANFAAAAANADWTKAPGFYLLLLNQHGATAWPITGATFILMHKQQSDAATAQAVLKFFDWAYTSGDAAADQLDYVPLPAPVKDLVRKSWAGIVGPDGKPVYAAAH